MDNSEIASKIGASLDAVLAWVETTDVARFVIEQAPLVVQEFLAWRFWQAVAWGSVSLLVPVLLLLAIAVYWRIFFKKQLWTKNDDGAAVCVGLFCTVLFLAVAVAFISTGVMGNFMAALQIHMAPRVYLIEQLPKLMP